jgi:phage tail sheath protein FI
MVVVRDTRNAGKQTMLWHCFTSQVKQDSFKFLSIVRLVLYMKKFLRPILESYLEEPNIWSTWAAMYLEVKPELDDLVTRDAISEYEWLGDQNASSYKDLQINNEADVRQGKYKVILKFKDIVPIQEISLTLSIDKSSGTISTEINNE